MALLVKPVKTSVSTNLKRLRTHVTTVYFGKVRKFFSVYNLVIYLLFFLGGSDSSSSCSRGRTLQRLERTVASSSEVPLENNKNDVTKVALSPAEAGSDVEQSNFQFASSTPVTATASSLKKDTSTKQQQQQQQPQQQQDSNIGNYFWIFW